MATLNSFEDLKCWKACREVVNFSRKITKRLPREEKFDMISNLNRAARSSTRNIAEGFGRHHHKENIQFCRISRGSLTEVLDDFITCRDEEYISEEELKQGRELVNTAIRLINGYIKYLGSLKK